MTIGTTIDLVRYATWGVFESLGSHAEYEGDAPSSIIASIIVQILEEMSNPLNGDVWPLYISSMPDDSDVEDDCGSIYDSPGVINARLMEDGEVVEHHGIQIKIRSTDYETGFRKIRGLALDLDAVKNQSITLDDNTYTVNNLARVGTIGYLGIEKESKRRYLFSVNFIACIDGLN